MAKSIPTVLLALFLTLVEGIDYGPSISSLTGVYIDYRNGAADLINIDSRRKLKLEAYPGYSATLPLITGHTTATSEQIFKERGISTSGEFVVEAPNGFGILLVVQELRLRKTTISRGTNTSVVCSDYIQVAEVRRDGTPVSETICGIAVKGDNNLKPRALLGSRTFRSSQNRIRVSFNHAYVAELVESLLGSKQKHVLKAELTFTAYTTNCSSVQSNRNSFNTTNASHKNFLICRDYKSSANNYTCISSQAFCDDIFNCGGDNETLGSDDDADTCPDKPVRVTEIPPQDLEEGDENNPLAGLENYLGISSLAPYTTKKYERKFRPSYVSGSSSSSGFLSDYSLYNSAKRRPETSVVSSTTASSQGGSIEINVIGPSRETDANHLSPQYDSPLDHENSGVYNRREIAHAINSVIYGVAVFIIFTIFITVLVVCVTRKVQMVWTAREEVRRPYADSSVNSETAARRNSTPGILPHIVSLTIPGDGGSRRASSFECDVGTVVSYDNVVVIDEEDPDNYGPPPAYDTLFPSSP